MNSSSGLARVTSRLIQVSVVLLFAGTALAATTTFMGADNGAPTTGPFPNSTAAQADFGLAASAYGPITTITFQQLPVGYSQSFTASYGVDVTLTGPDLTPVFGPGFSGVSDITLGNHNGFNTTPNGSHWLGFPEGTATFSFAYPNHSFGFFLTGLDVRPTIAVNINYNDGTCAASEEALCTLHTFPNVNGGAQYFGFVDTNPFTSVTISTTSFGFPGPDMWGIDDVTVNAPVPEPSSLVLLGTGALAAFGALKRKLLA